MRASILLLVCATAAGAQDAFEIQVYDASTAPPLTAGVEVHLNGVLRGSEQPSAAGELPTHHVAHATLEPHLGLTEWLEAGAATTVSFAVDPALRKAKYKPPLDRLRY